MDKIHVVIPWQEAFNAICTELYMGYEIEKPGGLGVYNDNGVLYREDSSGRREKITDDPEKLLIHTALDVIRRQLRIQERRLEDAK